MPPAFFPPRQRDYFADAITIPVLAVLIVRTLVSMESASRANSAAF
jgi:hypothetical protein